MNKEELNRLLDHIYELEGLVHLALAREDCPESLPDLIVRKAHALNDMVCEIGSSELGASGEADSLEGVSSGQEVVVVEEEKQVEEEDAAPVGVETVSDIDVPVVSDDVPEILPDESIEENYAVNTLDHDVVGQVNISENDETEDSAFAPYPLPVEDDPGSTPVQSIEEQKEERFVSPQKIVEPRGKLVFTINDRYRFKRDLFCNSDADFNTTLALVASMDSYEEAEDYFLDELQWNLQREEVVDFLEILKNYFK